MTQTRDTGRKAEHRELRFETIDECLEEIDRILLADKHSRLQASGNWTPGQVMSHVAAWIEYGYEGFPIGPPPFFVRWFLRLRLRSMLQKGMPRGVRIPGVRQGTTGMEEIPTQEAGERLGRAFRRLQAGEPAKFASPAFGPMSHEDRIALNLRHAELHLGFLHIDQPAEA